MPHFASGMWEVPDGLVREALTQAQPYTIFNDATLYPVTLGTYTAEREGWVRITCNSCITLDANLMESTYLVNINFTYTTPSGVARTHTVYSQTNAQLFAAKDTNGLVTMTASRPIYVKDGTVLTAKIEFVMTEFLGEFQGDSAIGAHVIFEYDR